MKQYQAAAAPAFSVPTRAPSSSVFRLHSSRQGCLITNSMTELGTEDRDVVRRSREYRARLAAVFRRALDNAERFGELGPGDNSARMRLLTAATIGFFVHLRSSEDPDELCDLLDAIIEQVSAW